MAWCLPKHLVKDFKKALINREIRPDELVEMTSEERRDFLVKYVGKENVQRVNSLFESKLLLKNQKAGMITWAKRTAGISEQTKMDLVSRIERLDKVLSPAENEQFLQDLASTRLKIDVTREEAKKIHDLSQDIQKTKDKADEKGVFKTEEARYAYGIAKVQLEKYVNELKLNSRKISPTKQPLEAGKKVISEIPGTMKSFMSSLDNSFFGRQGIKALLDVRTSGLWIRNFIKSWGDISNEIVGIDAMDLIRADIYSRPNSLNGKYNLGKYGLDVLNEEAFPNSIPEKIPALGRLFKASESAFSGGALRLRADLADVLIERAESQGVNTLNRDEARGIGHLVGSLTGRGSLGKAEPLSRDINLFFFSVKFLKSNFDTLTAHRGIFGIGADKIVLNSKFARKESAMATLRIVGMIAGILTIAFILDPDSIDRDPRSTNFGKVKLFGRWVDITGGMSSLARLGARLLPTKRNGEWGLWSKSSTGNWTNLTSSEYGQKDGWDMLIDSLVSNKLSPVASILRDAWRGEMFGGEPFKITKAITNSVTPLSIQTFNDIKDDKTSNIVGLMILEGLGFSIGTYKYKANWGSSTSKEMKQFQEKVGEEKFKRANDDFNRAYNVWFDEVTKTDEYKELTDDGKSKLITGARGAIKDKIFKEYGFKYKEEKKTPEEKEESKIIKDLKKKISMLKPNSLITQLSDGIVKKAYAEEDLSKLSEKKKIELKGLEEKIERFKIFVEKRKKSNLVSPELISVQKKKLEILKEDRQNIVDRKPIYDKTTQTEYEKKTVEIFDEYMIPREVAYGMWQAEGGKIGKNNPFNIGAYDSDTSKAVNYDTDEQGAKAFAKLMSGVFKKTNGEIDSKYKDAWENRGDAVKMLKMIEQSGYAGDPKTWKERSAKEGGAGLNYDSWSEFVMDTREWKKWTKIRTN